MKCKYFAKNAFAARKLIALREENVPKNACASRVKGGMVLMAGSW